MRAFEKAILATCQSCYISEPIVVTTIKAAKQIIKENYGWTESKEGWVCSECSQA